MVSLQLCTLQHVLIPVRGLKAGDKVSYIGLTSERASFLDTSTQPIKRSALLEVPVEFLLSC